MRGAPFQWGESTLWQRSENNSCQLINQLIELIDGRACGLL